MTLQVTRRKPPPTAPQATEPPDLVRGVARRRHWVWLIAGFPFAFAVPFLLEPARSAARSLLRPLRLAVAGFIAAWARDTRLDSVATFTRNWSWGIVLGAAGAAVMALIVLRTEDATSRPGGIELWLRDPLARRALRRHRRRAAVRLPDPGRLRSFAGTRLRQRVAGKVLSAGDRHGRVDRDHRRLPPGVFAVPVREGTGADDGRRRLERADAVDGLSPSGASTAHAGLHISAVLHSYETDMLLPPPANRAETKRAEARIRSFHGRPNRGRRRCHGRRSSPPCDLDNRKGVPDGR